MYTDLLPRIKNAQAAKKDGFLAPFSKMDFSVARTLLENKYIRDVQKKTVNRKIFLEIKLLYDDGRPAMSDFKFVSKPSRHVYSTYRSLRPVRNGYGIGVISTPQGIVSDREARRNKIGGEYLFQVW